MYLHDYLLFCDFFAYTAAFCCGYPRPIGCDADKRRCAMLVKVFFALTIAMAAVLLIPTELG